VAAVDPAHIAWAAEVQGNITVEVTSLTPDAGSGDAGADMNTGFVGGFPFTSVLVAGSQASGVYFTESIRLLTVEGSATVRYIGSSVFSAGLPSLLAPDRDAAGFVYWIDAGNDGGPPQLRRISKSAGTNDTPDPWTATVATPMGLTATTQPYWIDGTKLYTAAGASPQEVWSLGNPVYATLTTDGEYVYFADQAGSTGYAVYRLRVAH
jgi:hypothetical protein